MTSHTQQRRAVHCYILHGSHRQTHKQRKSDTKEEKLYQPIRMSFKPGKTKLFSTFQKNGYLWGALTRVSSKGAFWILGLDLADGSMGIHICKSSNLKICVIWDTLSCM